ncbi:DUF4339 domain-containing protein [Alienimonas californiensis]|uniref:GYF domain-containing protein n=1 Tax=Alienimonas californiensis TaxID=2527989 RepID=A0A517P6P8_9PLAN|nr:hypothetical protein CA12_11210 [Alienimonas californiensis]
MRSSQLKALADRGQLTPEDLVRRDGLDGWRPASKVEGLFETPKSSPLPADRTKGESAGRTAGGPVVFEQVGPADRSPERVPDDGDDPAGTVDAEAPADAGPGPVAAAFSGGGRLATGLSVVGGFVGDVLTPLGPINGYLAAAAACGMVVSAFAYWRLRPTDRSRWERLFPQQAIVFCTVSLAGFGFWLVAEQLADDDRGVVADHVAAVAAVQNSLLDLQGKVDDVKSDTVAILGETRRIGAGIEELGDLGGLLKDPSTPAEYYHNARVHALEGSFGEAFDDYARYVEFNQAFVDPLADYADLLRVQRGHVAARRELAGLATRFPENPAVRLAAAELEERAERVSRLERLRTDVPDFAPASLALADAYSAAGQADRSGVDADREREYLAQFLEAADAGEVHRWYLDKQRAIAAVKDARGRATAAAGPGGGLVTKTRVFLGDRGREVWVMDPAVVAIEYTFDPNIADDPPGADGWRETADLVRTIVLARGPLEDVPADEPGWDGMIYVRFRDERGQWGPVYPLDFYEARRAHEEHMRKTFGPSGAPHVPEVPEIPKMPSIPSFP